MNDKFQEVQRSSQTFHKHRNKLVMHTSCRQHKHTSRQMTVHKIPVTHLHIYADINTRAVAWKWPAPVWDKKFKCYIRCSNNWFSCKIVPYTKWMGRLGAGHGCEKQSAWDMGAIYFLNPELFGLLLYKNGQRAFSFSSLTHSRIPLGGSTPTLPL